MKLLSLCLVLLLCFSCANNTSDKIQVVTSEEMEILLQQDDVQLVDVRTVEEYSSGFISDAQNINFLSETFEVDIQKLDKTKPVLLYCKKGGRSAKCAKKMEDFGFVKIYDLDGGYSKWLAEQK